MRRGPISTNQIEREPKRKKQRLDPMISSLIREEGVKKEDMTTSIEEITLSMTNHLVITIGQAIKPES